MLILACFSFDVSKYENNHGIYSPSRFEEPTTLLPMELVLGTTLMSQISSMLMSKLLVKLCLAKLESTMLARGKVGQ
jgi:hypothetical protein